MHTTNTQNTLIVPAKDCKPVAKPPEKAGSVAALQYEILVAAPYDLTSDEVLSSVAAARKGIADDAFPQFRETFFSKGQPCFRASPLTKTNGWAVHANEAGRLAVIDPNSADFETLIARDDVDVIPAMRNKRV